MSERPPFVVLPWEELSEAAALKICLSWMGVAAAATLVLWLISDTCRFYLDRCQDIRTHI